MATSPRRVFRDALRVVPDSVANRKNPLRAPCQVAVSTEVDAEGTWLHVHVPDVAAYIPHGSMHEVNAQKRQRSIYTPETSITMLPFQLEAGLCFPIQSTSPLLAITYSTHYPKDGGKGQSRVALTVLENITVMTYSQVEASRTPNATWRMIRELTALSLVRRAANGALLIDFDDLACIEVMPQTVHCLTHEMVFKEPGIVATTFAGAPVRVSLSKMYHCAAHYVVRELEIIAGEAALAHAEGFGTLSLLTQTLPVATPRDASFSLFSSLDAFSAAIDVTGTKGDIFTVLCEAMRDCESNVQLLRSLFPRKGLGTRILPCTNPLGSHAELYTQYVLHAICGGAQWVPPTEHNFEILTMHGAFVDARVHELVQSRRSALIAQWVAQQPLSATAAIRRIKCVVIQRSFDRTVCLVPILGHSFTVAGGGSVWGGADIAMVPLPCLCLPVPEGRCA